jgi:hypothetical protein
VFFSTLSEIVSDMCLVWILVRRLVILICLGFFSISMCIPIFYYWTDYFYPSQYISSAWLHGYCIVRVIITCTAEGAAAPYSHGTVQSYQSHCYPFLYKSSSVLWDIYICLVYSSLYF